MIVVGGVTYRIERTKPHCYVAVRLLDDREVGTFCTLPSLRLEPSAIDASLLREIVRVAMRAARTSGVMHAIPAFRSNEDVEPVKSPSSGPPRPVVV